MRVTSLFAPLVSFALSPAVHGIEVYWYTTRSCDNGASETYRNVACTSCVDPLFDWYAVSFTGLGPDNRVSIHNENKCTSKSQVGQFYGDVCNVAGATALRSAWVACPGEAA